MGQIESVPVISQIKSLVQVIGGDAKGAKKTQETFSRTAPIVSQVNSLAHSIKGDNEEAKRIQEAYLKDTIAFAENAPILGHAMSAAWAIGGKTERAERVALGATKGVVTAAAGAAGLLCGPGAPACAAGLVVATSTGWDAAESGIRGEKMASVKAWDDLVHGRSDVGGAFDLIGGTLLEAGTAALGAKTAGKKVGGTPKKIGGTPNKIGGTPKKIGGTPKKPGGKLWNLAGCRRKKREADDGLIFDHGLPDIPQTINLRLPSSVSHLSFNDTMTASSIIDNVLSIFFVLRLMGIGHVKSKPYYDEICYGVYPSMQLEECTRMMFESLSKYNDDTPANPSDFQLASNHTQFTDLLDGVEFEMMSLSKNTIMGHILEVAACDVLGPHSNCLELEKELRKGLEEVDNFTGRLIVKRRVKRAGDRCVAVKPSRKNKQRKKKQKQKNRQATKKRRARIARKKAFDSHSMTKNFRERHAVYDYDKWVRDNRQSVLKRKNGNKVTGLMDAKALDNLYEKLDQDLVYRGKPQTVFNLGQQKVVTLQNINGKLVKSGTLENPIMQTVYVRWDGGKFLHLSNTAESK